MNLPIPTHLQQFLTPTGNKNDEFEVTGTIHCSCGNETFAVMESNDRQIAKLLCKKCGHEILLFDADKHGWDGFVCKGNYLNHELPFHNYMCTKCNKDCFRVIVKILSQGKQDFIDECASDDDSFSADNWVNGFEWITVSLACDKCAFKDNDWIDLETM